MTYFDFLGHWYNLAFLAIGAAGLVCAAWGRVRGRDLFRAATTLLVAAVTGLTWNGTIHDLGLGSPAPRFLYVLVGSMAAGWLAGRWASRIRARHFMPISAVRFNRDGHEGVEARLVTRSAGVEPGSGRAQKERSTSCTCTPRERRSGLGAACAWVDMTPGRSRTSWPPSRAAVRRFAKGVRSPDCDRPSADVVFGANCLD